MLSLVMTSGAALSRELSAAAERMTLKLDGAIAALREANEPTQEEEYRRRALGELGDEPFDLDFGTRPA